MPADKVTLVWGYRENKPPMFKQLLEEIQERIQPLENSYNYSERPVNDIHITVLGCEAKEHDGKFYSLPLLQHLFNTCKLNKIDSSQLADKHINFEELKDVLHTAFKKPITVQFGGYKESSWPPLLYSGWSLYRMSFY